VAVPLPLGLKLRVSLPELLELPIRAISLSVFGILSPLPPVQLPVLFHETVLAELAWVRVVWPRSAVNEASVNAATAARPKKPATAEPVSDEEERIRDLSAHDADALKEFRAGTETDERRGARMVWLGRGKRDNLGG